MKKFLIVSFFISTCAFAQEIPVCQRSAEAIDHGLEDYLNNTGQVISEMEVNENPIGLFYITWGYNRGFHSSGDITVSAPEGEFTIKDAQAYDRPKKLGLDYIDPTRFTVPQYNVRIGYWPSQDSKIGFEAGTDHMKWVFDHTKEYKIEGDYKEVWVKGEKLSFDDAKALGDASFFLYEHSDGYNYPFVGVVYREKLLDTKRLGLVILGGVHAGALFPKTRTRIADQDNTAAYRGVDNKFNVAGFAGSLDVRLRAKYKLKNGASFFLEPAARGVAGKVNNGHFLGSGSGRVTQSVIYTAQPMLSGGVEIPLSIFKRKKEKLDN